MARNLKYGEETVLFARKVPKSKLSKVEDLVDRYLGTVEIDIIKKDSKETKSKKIVVPRSVRGDVVDSPPAKATKVKKEVITGEVITNDKGFVAYPCGCLDDGFLRRNPHCKIGDQKDHKIVYE